MYFIAKNNKQTIAISDSEKLILLNGSTDDNDSINHFINKLLRLKDDFWIKCTCCDNALLIICALHGKIYIRCKSRAKHDINCLFIQKNIVFYTKYFKPTYSKRTKQFFLYTNVTDIVNNDTNIGSIETKNVSCTKLGQILFTILDDAKVNIFYTNSSISVFEQLTLITNAFNDDQKLIAKNIPLKTCYRYLLNDMMLAKTQIFLQKANYWFPTTLEPFVIFTSIVTKITYNSFITKKDNKTYKVANKISTTSHWINLDKSAPYFLAVSAIIGKDNQIILKDAFAIPIFSTRLLMPIESNYERTILKIILAVVNKYYNITIIKPLFDFITDNKEKYRPDFVIIHNNNKIFIEVLGSNNPDYLAHKNHINRIAKPACNYFIAVKAFDLQNNYDRFIYDLTNALQETL